MLLSCFAFSVFIIRTICLISLAFVLMTENLIDELQIPRTLSELSYHLNVDYTHMAFLTVNLRKWTPFIVVVSSKSVIRWNLSGFILVNAVNASQALFNKQQPFEYLIVFTPKFSHVLNNSLLSIKVIAKNSAIFICIVTCRGSIRFCVHSTNRLLFMSAGYC